MSVAHDARQMHADLAAAQTAHTRAEQGRQQQGQQTLLATLLAQIDPALLEADRTAAAAAATTASELQQAEQALQRIEQSLPASAADDTAWAGQVNQARIVVDGRRRRHAAALEECQRARSRVIGALDAERLKLLRAREQQRQRDLEEGTARFQEQWQATARLQAKIRQCDAEHMAALQALATLDVRKL